MTIERGTYSDGYVERKAGGKYEGELAIDGVSLSPILAVFFKEEGKSYLWLRRAPLLEYDFEELRYKQRQREPRWEAYLSKYSDGKIAYRGECAFLHFKYEITCIWDDVFGKTRNRLNLFVERLPMNRQTIINSIKERNINGKGRKD